MLLNLNGKKILVTGIANNRSIAWGIAQQLSKAGAELGITYLPDDKGRFESKVRELTVPSVSYTHLTLPTNACV